MKDGSQACLNHDLGSSTAEELLYYYPRLIKPWEPRALVVSIVHNDRGWGYSAGEIMDNLAKLFAYARTDFPDFWKDPADAGIYDESKLREDIFEEDRVHFNQLGYDIYAEFMRKQLDELL